MTRSKPAPRRPSLEKLLQQTQNYVMSPAEIREQRISFVYGQLMDCAPHVTKEQIADVLDKHDAQYAKPGMQDVVGFAAWLVKENALKDDKPKCTSCGGNGKIYSSDEPRDPIEGNKMRSMLQCTICKGTGIGTMNAWIELFNAKIDRDKKEFVEKERRNALRKSGLSKLTVDEREALGLPKTLKEEDGCLG